MKINSLVLIVLFPLFANAQTVDVNDVKADSDSTTTIQIKKGKAGETIDNKAKWEVQDGTADVEGEASATGKDAKKAWNKACADWKKEFREDNKDNKVLSLNCGTSTCGGEAGSKVCTSKATFKIKTRSE